MSMACSMRQDRVPERHPAPELDRRGGPEALEEPDQQHVGDGALKWPTRHLRSCFKALRLLYDWLL